MKSPLPNQIPIVEWYAVDLKMCIKEQTPKVMLIAMAMLRISKPTKIRWLQVDVFLNRIAFNPMQQALI